MEDILDMFSDMSNNEKNHRNVVLVDVSYFAQRAFHGYFRSNEKVCHVSMRYTLLYTLLNRFKQLNISPMTHRIVFCYDGKNYWQKVIAPYYKCRRKEKRRDGKDWEGFANSMKSLRDELIEYFPFTVLYIDDVQWYNENTQTYHRSGLEADDVIGILSKRLTSEDRNVIVMTGDGDFTQLDYLPNLKIIGYDGGEIKAEHGCGTFDLIHKIVNGDAKDDVANINMRSNYWETKMDGERQISAKELARSICDVEDPFTLLTPEQSERYIENRILKDFNYIPKEMVEYVNKVYDEYDVNHNGKFRELFLDLQVKDEIIQDNLVDLIEKVL